MSDWKSSGNGADVFDKIQNCGKPPIDHKAFAEKVAVAEEIENNRPSKERISFQFSSCFFLYLFLFRLSVCLSLSTYSALFRRSDLFTSLAWSHLTIMYNLWFIQCYDLGDSRFRGILASLVCSLHLSFWISQLKRAFFIILLPFPLLFVKIMDILANLW